MTVLASESEAKAFVAERCDDAALARLERYIVLLLEENGRQNLIARASEAHIWQRHIADSAQLLDHVPRETVPSLWLDLGTGAGLPGLVIAAMRPDWRVMLVESRRRRHEWLAQTAGALGLDHCQVAGQRLEAIETVPASVISARAFAPLDRLLNLSTRFSTADTLWLLPKGRSAAQELADAPKQIRRMFHVEQSCTDHEAGILVGRIAQNRTGDRAQGRAGQA